jgi:hypothetical protein
MDTKLLKDRIKSLDSIVHRSLVTALTTKYGDHVGKREGGSAKEHPTPEDFEEFFKQTAEEINDTYIEGTIDYIYEHQHQLAKKIDRIEDRLDKVWRAGLEGNAGLEEFRSVLKDWRLLYQSGIELFNNEDRN